MRHRECLRHERLALTKSNVLLDARKLSRKPWLRWGGPLTLVVTAVLIGAIVTSRSEAATNPGLGTAQSFAVLAGAGITNTGVTTINGDVGSYPTTTQSGFSSVTLNGTNHLGDAVTQGAKTDLTTAYNNVAGQSPVTVVPTELGSTTLIPGVYQATSGTFGITGTVTLNGQGDPNAVFIFKMSTTLVTAAGSSVNLIGGTQACNVFWQVGSSATLGTNSTFRGNILALSSITLTTGANVIGRALARNGAVTMDTNTITAADCAALPTSTATSTSTATATATGTTIPGTIVPTSTTIPATIVPTSTTIPGTTVPTSTPLPGATLTPTSTNTSTPTLTSTPTPELTATPIPTSTPIQTTTETPIVPANTPGEGPGPGTTGTPGGPGTPAGPGAPGPGPSGGPSQGSGGGSGGTTTTPAAGTPNTSIGQPPQAPLDVPGVINPPTAGDGGLKH